MGRRRQHVQALFAFDARNMLDVISRSRPARPLPGSQPTRRWREVDSNPRSPVRGVFGLGITGPGGRCRLPALGDAHRGEPGAARLGTKPIGRQRRGAGDGKCRRAGWSWWRRLRSVEQKQAIVRRYSDPVLSSPICLHRYVSHHGPLPVMEATRAGLKASYGDRWFKSLLPRASSRACSR
jgi:hypothetical protein